MHRYEEDDLDAFSWLIGAAIIAASLFIALVALLHVVL